MAAKWQIPTRGDERRAIDALIFNSRRLHEKTPATLAEGDSTELADDADITALRVEVRSQKAEIAALRDKLNELLRFISGG